jgi:hypothetical protein
LTGAILLRQMKENEERFISSIQAALSRAASARPEKCGL